MPTRFLTACSIAIVLNLVVAAQQAHPPNGPAIPVVRLTGDGTGAAGQAPRPGKADEPSTWNMEVVGHDDLQGRSAYQPTLISQNGRVIAYVGHHDNQKPIVNPMTGKPEINGTSVVDVTDPARPSTWRTLPRAVAARRWRGCAVATRCRRASKASGTCCGPTATRRMKLIQLLILHLSATEIWKF